MKNAPFRVLVVAGLPNDMLDCYISLILRSGNIDIDRLRSKPGLPHEHVTYICPPSALQKKPVLSFFLEGIVFTTSWVENKIQLYICNFFLSSLVPSVSGCFSI